MNPEATATAVTATQSISAWAGWGIGAVFTVMGVYGLFVWMFTRPRPLVRFQDVADVSITLEVLAQEITGWKFQLLRQREPLGDTRVEYRIIGSRGQYWDVLPASYLDRGTHTFSTGRSMTVDRNHSAIVFVANQQRVADDDPDVGKTTVILPPNRVELPPDTYVCRYTVKYGERDAPTRERSFTVYADNRVRWTDGPMEHRF